MTVTKIRPLAKPSRRQILAGVVGLATGSRALKSMASAQTPTRARRLDVHHHMFTPEAVETFAANFDNGAPGPLRLGWTPAKSLEAMEVAGIDTALLSCNIPFGDDPAAAHDDIVRVAREMNDYGARQVSEYPERFGLLAALPLPHMDASLREISAVFIPASDCFRIRMICSSVWRLPFISASSMPDSTLIVGGSVFGRQVRTSSLRIEGSLRRGVEDPR